MKERQPQKEKLTDKQELFCRFKANGKTGSDAYRAAFNSKASNQVLSQKACILGAMPKIQARIEELKAPEKDNYIWTRNIAVMHLLKIVESEIPAFALGAIKELNIMHGFDKPLPGVNEADEDPIGITVIINDARKPITQATIQPQEVH